MDGRDSDKRRRRNPEYHNVSDTTTVSDLLGTKEHVLGLDPTTNHKVPDTSRIHPFLVSLRNPHRFTRVSSSLWFVVGVVGRDQRNMCSAEKDLFHEWTATES